jgi:hypothetical protein
MVNNLKNEQVKIAEGCLIDSEKAEDTNFL